MCKHGIIEAPNNFTIAAFVLIIHSVEVEHVTIACDSDATASGMWTLSETHLPNGRSPFKEMG